jgi:hypothetical protein
MTYLTANVTDPFLLFIVSSSIIINNNGVIESGPLDSMILFLEPYCRQEMDEPK